MEWWYKFEYNTGQKKNMYDLKNKKRKKEKKKNGNIYQIKELDIE
jgi:hypothetical protein